MAQSDPFGLVGQVLDGQFRVDASVGEGGFSAVYRGTHVGLSEPIAIKCLKLPAALGSALVESFVRRFRDESRLHYKLSQGNLHVVRSIASGTVIAPATSALVPYTVLEWLEGRSLADEFVDRRTRGLRGRPLVDAVRLLDSAVDAVAYAHAQGVVHRDLNPGNLFLAQTPSGPRLKVLDFGVAKILADAAIAMGPTARTVGNVRMFAPAYGAPEQFDEGVGAIGPWTDVYALALVLLEALTDRTAMEGQHLGEFALKALDPANRPTPRDVGVPVGDEVQRVLAKATAIEPSQRPQDAGEMWGMLKHAMSVDAASGRAAHALRAPSEPPPPQTMRMNTAVPEVPPPVVEVVRRSSAPPPGGPGLSPMAFTGPSPRTHAGTLRMAQSPRSATEALAATPPPSPLSPMSPAAPLSPMSNTGPTSPYGATRRMATPPPASPASPGPDLSVPRAPSVPLTPTPAPVSRAAAPPPILYSSALGREGSRGGAAWLVALVVVLLGAVVGGGWWIATRGHRGGPPPAASSGG